MIQYTVRVNALFTVTAASKEDAEESFLCDADVRTLGDADHYAIEEIAPERSPW